MTDRRTGGRAPGSERRGDAGENPVESLELLSSSLVYRRDGHHYRRYRAPGSSA